MAPVFEDAYVDCWFHVFSHLLYAAEMWTLKAEYIRILAFKLRLYWRLLKVCTKDKVSHENTLNRQITSVDVTK